ncbi:MAG: aspartate aminotransferase family protein [Actinobacteria bacterium]|nr:aspartate aminotransferase family protein [Actinomycetota bacterium]
MTTESNDLYRDLEHLVSHRTTRAELAAGIPIIERGLGCKVWDTTGKEYLDLVAGVTRPVGVGYGRKELAQAMAEQAEKLCYFTPMQYSNPPAIGLAKKLASLLPGDVNEVFFASSGSEAVESALKLAKQHYYYKGEQKRYKIIARRGAYHGQTMGALSILGSVHPMRQVMEPAVPGAVFVDPPYCYRCPWKQSYPGCDLLCAETVKDAIEFEMPDMVAAVIGEPIMQGFGALAMPKEYWQRVREICDHYDILLIVDEVITGFGRTGTMFASEALGLVPDIMTMAKQITSGYIPLSAAACRPKVTEHMPAFLHLHTWGSHPVACAVGLKNIEIIENEGLVARSAEVGGYFLAALKELETHPLVGEARGTGLWCALDLTSDKTTRAMFAPADHPGPSLVSRAREKGLIIKMMGPALEFAPPLVISKDELDWAVSVLDEVLSEEENARGLV